MMILSFSMRRDFDGEVYFGRSLTVKCSVRKWQSDTSSIPAQTLRLEYFSKPRKRTGKNITPQPKNKEKNDCVLEKHLYHGCLPR